jgi:peptide deformylase
VIREIVKFGDPRLSERNEEVVDFGPELQALVRDLVETCHAAPGLGLAAPQIGVNRRVAIVDLSIGAEPSGVVLSAAGEIRAEEGCLSIPGLSEPLTRPARVVVEAADAEGTRRRIEGEGLFARALLHESDHLDSRLFVDRLRGLKGELVRRKIARRLRR